MKTSNKLLVILILAIISLSYAEVVIQVGNTFTGIKLPKKIRDDFEKAVDKIDYAGLFKPTRGEIVSTKNIRIDMQETFPRDGFTVYNIQAQINGLKNQVSTVAHIEVYSNVMTNDKKQYKAIAKLAKKALEDSESSGKTMRIVSQ